MPEAVAITGRDYEDIREMVRHGGYERRAAYAENFEAGDFVGIPFTVGLIAVMPDHTAYLRRVAGEEFDGGKAWEFSFRRTLSITPDGLHYYSGETGLIDAVRAVREVIEKYGY